MTTVCVEKSQGLYKKALELINEFGKVGDRGQKKKKINDID